jgi:dCMP deaminase
MISKKEHAYNKNLLKWDTYFYNLCKAVGKNSSCLSRHIGAVLVKDNSIISTGYNGPPRGVPHCGERYLIDKKLREKLESVKIDPDNDGYHETCPRYAMGYKSGQGLEWCIAGHAERNALINAARNGIKTKKCKVYMDCNIPCTPCLIELINAGITEIIVTDISFYDSSAQYLLENSSMKLRLYSHCCSHQNLLPDTMLKSNIAGHCDDCGMAL